MKTNGARRLSKIEQLVIDLNKRLYAAAEKAGFVSVLREMQIEVIATYGTDWKPVITWDPETLEAGVEYNESVLDRAKIWLERALKAA